MKRIAKAAAVGTAGLGLIFGSTPAQAVAHSCHFTFVGTGTASPVPPLPAPGAGVDGTWTFTSTVGVGATTEGLISGPVVINVSGDLHVGLVNTFGPGAFTGLSGGSDGAGTIVCGNDVFRVSDVGWKQSAAGVIPFTGDTLVRNTTRVGGGLEGVAYALPVPGNGTFTVVGWGVATYTV